MLDRIKLVKQKLNETIEQLNEASWMFIKNPERDFSRIRKLPFSIVVGNWVTGAVLCGIERRGEDLVSWGKWRWENAD